MEIVRLREGVELVRDVDRDEGGVAVLRERDVFGHVWARHFGGMGSALRVGRWRVVGGLEATERQGLDFIIWRK